MRFWLFSHLPLSFVNIQSNSDIISKQVLDPPYFVDVMYEWTLCDLSRFSYPIGAAPDPIRPAGTIVRRSPQRPRCPRRRRRPEPEADVGQGHLLDERGPVPGTKR